MEQEVQPAVLSVEQTARKLGISAHSARGLGKRGDIPTVHYLGRVFFRVEDVEAFIEAHTFEAA